ncbi:MAG TPA: methyltransferase domain-containing protein [Pseudonocardiaceae bacterium]|jgi:SAM-dependent methyltransferase|nr:methyltransferase domain-containing protein [Pseudonocardiaceae bacterium]
MTEKDRRTAPATMWGLADYTGLAQLLDPAAEALVDVAAPGAGDRVLDVAAGTGNVAMRAVARSARVTACDIAPRMVHLGRARTGPAVEWIEADVEDLPLPNATVDVALSAFGVIFAPRPEAALSELRRVLAPGGRLGLTAWTVDGWIAERARIVREFVPTDPTAPDALSWGNAEVLEERLSTEFADVRIERRSLPWHFDSGEALTEFLTAHSPAHVVAKQAAGDRADEMVTAIEKHASPDGGPVRIEAEYLLALAHL